MHAQTTGGTGALRELLHEANRAGLDATGRERIEAVTAASGLYAARLPAGDDAGARETSAAPAATIRIDK